MKIVDAIAATAKLFEEHSIDEPRREAELIVAFTISKDRTFLIAHPEFELPADAVARLEGLAHRRADHEPFHYITGHKEFYGLNFIVTPDVLIPRPETEILVERAIRLLSSKEHETLFCEVGVGSGCITVAILKNVTSARAVALDISPAAIAVAAQNADAHRVLDRIELVESNVFDQVRKKRFDMIVSNPPYIPFSDIATLQAEVRDFEPASALTDHGDGLSIIRRLVGESPELLHPGGDLLIEIGFGQADEVAGMFGRDWRSIEFLPDLQGIPRIVHSQLGS